MANEISFADKVAQLAEKFSGILGFCAERLDNAARLAYNADEIFPAASVVKLPVLVELFRRASIGKLSLEEKLTLAEADKVIGSGVLKELRAGTPFTLDDLAFLMISISDNTAANMLMDRLGIEDVNRTMKTLGLMSTRVAGQILIDQTFNTDTGEGKGERSPTTPSDMVRLMKCIERRRYLDGASGELHERMLYILKHTQTDSIIGQGLPYDLVHPLDGKSAIEIAYKTGSIRGVRNDVGIVYTPDFSYAIALMSKNSQDMRRTPDHEGRVVLKEISAMIYREFLGEK